MRRSLALALLLVALPAYSASPEELRTLFHTPEERARLDRLRRGEPEHVPAAAPAARAGAVTGFVKRSDGRDTVWLDGEPRVITGKASGPYTDPSKVRDPYRGDAPPIEIKRSK